MDTLFSSLSAAPLADTLRPTRIDDVVGQDHLLASGAPLRRMIDSRKLKSIILWGPPGTGKTTIARLIADASGMAFAQLSAVQSGVDDLRKAIAAAQNLRAGSGKSTILFLDEIHRWSKAQQDALLPHVENGTFTLIGATTENPSFSLIPALLSRSSVLSLNRLDEHALDKILARAEAHTGKPLPVTEEARAMLCRMADGDARYLIGLCDHLYDGGFAAPLDIEGVQTALQKRAPIHDRNGDSLYGLLSALQKSIRGSDEQAAIYYLARLIVAGEDMRVVLRRLAVIASEDIGLADPNAMVQAAAAAEVFERIGMPEGRYSLAQCVVYLATAPKSNSLHDGIAAALDFAEKHGSIPPPMHILNAPTRLMKDMGMHEGYVYDHNAPDSFSGQEFFPDKIAADGRPSLYQPKTFGFERDIMKRLAYWSDLRAKRRSERS